MPSAECRLLLVEDNPADAELTAAVLEGADVSFSICVASTLAEAEALLDSNAIDAVTLDLNLPDSRGLETLKRLRARHPDIAVIAMSGADSAQMRRDALAAGAQDFLSKNTNDSQILARCIMHAIERIRALETHRQMRRLIDANPDAMMVVDRKGAVRYANRHARKLFETGADHLATGWLARQTSGQITEFEVPAPEAPRIAEARTAEIEWEGAAAVLATIRDVTLTRQLQDRLREAQKMEAVGVLAGGLAHDFNNLLVVIMGNVEFLLETMEDDPRRAMVERIENAAERARQLTRQLLVFARRQPSKPQVLDPNRVLMKLYEMLRRSFPSTIELVALPADDVWAVKIDPMELDQVVMNLTFNARQALAEGGRIQIDLSNVVFFRREGRLEPGPYVAIRVVDNGSGIAPALMERIFEPFFTTKSSGTGTGLGLAICRNVALKAGGDVVAQSVAGAGSTFTLYLPRCDEAIEAEPAPERGAVRGTERILVVEDDAAVATALVQTLSGAGFCATHAQDGEQARRLLIRSPDGFDLVLCDVVMPQLSGPELAAWLSTARPTMKLLMMTGYADNAAALEAGPAPSRALIYKPFMPTELLRKIRTMLDGAPAIPA